MSVLSFSCPSCEQRIEGDENHAGMLIDCPTCGAKMVVPMRSTPEDNSVAEGGPDPHARSDSEPPVDRWDAATLTTHLASDLQLIERWRQKALAARKWGSAILKVVAPLAAVVLYLNLRHTIIPRLEDPTFLDFLPSILALAVLLGIGEGFFWHPSRRYTWGYQNRVILRAVELVHPGMSYHRGRGLSSVYFDLSGLCKAKVDRYDSEKLFEGMVGKTTLSFAEVHAERKRRFSGSDDDWKTVFEGILVMADFHKHFKSEVFVTPDTAEATFGWLGRSFQKLGGNLELMENPEFEKAFVVRATDPIEVRYILTPDMQLRLLALRNCFGAGVSISFRASRVFIALPQATIFPEPDLKRPANDHGQLDDLLGRMLAWFGIVEELNLNTRIWTKD